MLVKAGTKVDGERKRVEFEYEFGEDIDDAVEKHGEETLLAFFKKGAKQKLQSHIRRQLNNGKSKEEVIDYIKNDWELTVGKRRKSKSEKIAEEVEKMDAEERKRAIEKIKQQANKSTVSNGPLP